MGSLLVRLATAIIVSSIVYSTLWWAPVLIVPFVVRTAPLFREPALMLSSYRRLADSIAMLLQLGYVVGVTILFQVNIGQWYGWVLGLVIGFVLMRLLVPSRWYQERQLGI